VLFFSCEKSNNKASENNSRNNKLLADMSIQKLEDKIIECYANDIETTVEYTGTKYDFIQFIDNICGEKYIILNNYNFYDDKEFDYSIKIHR
jgi:predicted phosphohydrolase